MSKTVHELAQLIQGKVVGDGQVRVGDIATFESPKAGSITFIQNEKELPRLEASDIACLIVPSTIAKSAKPLIQVKNPKLAWAQLLAVFYPPDQPVRSISEKAVVSPSAKLGHQVTVEPFAVISEGAQIGDDTVIRSYVYLGKNVRVGARSTLHPGVVVYDRCVVGSGVTIHAGTVIGADGFGYVATPGRQEKVPQVGIVVIEDDVEIGACTTIDRATLGETRIGRDVKIDNQVQIAHNVSIGPHTAISAQTGISGSCKVGEHVTMGGKVGLGDHVEIGDYVMVGAGAGFATGKKVPPRQIVFGQPARPYQEARKQIGAQLRAAETLEDVRKLRKRVDELEKQIQKTSNPAS